MGGEANPIISLSLAWLPIAGLTLSLCIAWSLRALRHIGRFAAQPPSGGWPPVELGCRTGSSILHRWDPRCKLTALLGFALLAVSLSSLHLVFAAVLLAGACIALAGLPWRRPLRRLQSINGFLIMLLVVLPLTAATHPGDTLVVFGDLHWLTFNLRGLLLALTIVGKAWTVALLVEPMLATAPLAATMSGLKRLGVPRKVGELLLIAHRYLFVFCEEAARMHSGMLARGFRPRRSWAGLRDLGNFLGMLLVRSFERTQQVQQAMLARGYTGQLPQPQAVRAGPADWLGASLVIGLGCLLLLADRLAAG